MESFHRVETLLSGLHYHPRTNANRNRVPRSVKILNAANHHSPVYTMGTGSSEDYLNFDVQDAPFDVYRTERGGEVTYHGPGTTRWIFIGTSAFSIRASRLDGWLTGVWVGNQKVAAMGIRVSKWITYHGLALTV
ncbi:unnamed protein product [Brassica napus]|uniref:(rape) hypothetical protein n=1 Tax=Brassica napus TaxID=3708 RepID=A0A816IHD4_BRANA|nr:unnamed protein product [Brassica napus]